MRLEAPAKDEWESWVLWPLCLVQCLKFVWPSGKVFRMTDERIHHLAGGESVYDFQSAFMFDPQTVHLTGLGLC